MALVPVPVGVKRKEYFGSEDLIATILQTQKNATTPHWVSEGTSNFVNHFKFSMDTNSSQEFFSKSQYGK